LLALEIESDHAAAAKEDVDAFTIGCRRARGVAVLGNEPAVAHFGLRGGNVALPKDLAGLAVEARKMAD